MSMEYVYTHVYLICYMCTRVSIFGVGFGVVVMDTGNTRASISGTAAVQVPLFFLSLPVSPDVKWQMVFEIVYKIIGTNRAMLLLSE